MSFNVLFLVFILVPIAEIYLLLKVGGIIGALPTVGLVILTAAIGAALMRAQGFRTLAKLQSTVAAGGIPAVEIMEAVFILVSGALLLTPGFVTDALGFACLFPPFRLAVIRRFLARQIQSGFAGAGAWQTHTRPPGAPGSPSAGSGGRPASGRIIEGEFREAPRHEVPPPPDSNDR